MEYEVEYKLTLALCNIQHQPAADLFSALILVQSDPKGKQPHKNNEGIIFTWLCISRARNCDSLVANVTKNWGLATTF